MNLVAADVSPLYSKSKEVRADSRRLLQFRGSKRETSFGEFSPRTSPPRRGSSPRARQMFRGDYPSLVRLPWVSPPAICVWPLHGHANGGSLKGAPGQLCLVEMRGTANACRSVKLHSFDVFDTLLTRRVAVPADLIPGEWRNYPTGDHSRSIEGSAELGTALENHG